MKKAGPPAVAFWLLDRFSGNDALVGDVIEAYRLGRSDLWLWRQTMAAVLVRRTTAIAATAAIALLFMFGQHVAVPGVNSPALAALARSVAGNLRVYDVLSGGNLAPVSILALAIHPYATAAVAIQLLLWLRSMAFPRATAASPRLIVRATWGLAIIVCVVQALGLALFLERQSAAPGGLQLVAHPGWSFRIPVIVALTAATAGLMWISDALSRRDIGNGLLLVFIAGLLAGLTSLRPMPAVELIGLAMTGTIVTITAHFYRRHLIASAR